jgi:hypothetical protein
MSIFSHKYTEEGYYQQDEMGNVTKIYDNKDLIEALEENKLFYCDGYLMTIVNSIERSKKNRFDEML